MKRLRPINWLLSINWLKASKTLKDLNEGWGLLLKAAAVLVVAWWAVLQYRDRVEAEKVQAALDYRKQVNAEPLSTVWRQVTVIATDASQARAAAFAKGNQERIKYLLKIANDNRIDVDTLLAYFDELWQCTQREICDKGTVLALFGRDMRILIENYRPFIECIRSKYRDQEYGRGLTLLFSDYLLDQEHRLPDPLPPDFLAFCQ